MGKYKFKYKQSFIEKNKILLISIIFALFIILLVKLTPPKKVEIKINETESDICMKKFLIYCKVWKAFYYSQSMKPEGGWENYSKNYNCKGYVDSAESCEEFLKKIE
ncbi:MAG: hypothetical protein QW641_00820 [Candidatus Aenigmatarchaeota archaeon]